MLCFSFLFAKVLILEYLWPSTMERGRIKLAVYQQRRKKQKRNREYLAASNFFGNLQDKSSSRSPKLLLYKGRKNKNKCPEARQRSVVGADQGYVRARLPFSLDIKHTGKLNKIFIKTQSNLEHCSILYVIYMLNFKRII